jgi:hypothetical protein
MSAGISKDSEGREYFDWQGTPIQLGCLVPEFRPETFSAYADAPMAKMFTKDERLGILNHKPRTPARILFPAADYIRNQGGRGSCNGYAGAHTLEKARVKAGRKRVRLSGEGLYAQINGGRDGGSMLDRGMKAMTEAGVPPEALVPHEEYLWNRISSEAKAAMARFKALECYRVDTEDELASGLCAGFLGVIAVHVARGFESIDADGVVGRTDGPGNHAVGVDDIRFHNGEWQFDMVNSWGRRYGDDGRGWVSWNRHLRTTSRYHAFYLVRGSIDDPEGDNPPELQT